MPPSSTEPFSTPLLSTRTLHSLSTAPSTSTSTSNRVRIQQPQFNESHVPSGITMTAGRQGTLLRASGSGSVANVPATASRLPTRRPSVSASETPGSSLKRTSSTAGLRGTSLSPSLLSFPFLPNSSPPKPTEESGTTSRRALLQAQHDLSTLSHTHALSLHSLSTERSALESDLSSLRLRLEAAERALVGYKVREESLVEREKAVKELEGRRREEETREGREVRRELGEVKGLFRELGVRYRELEHRAKGAREGEERERNRVGKVEEECGRLEAEVKSAREEARREREEREKAEREIEKLQRRLSEEGGEERQGLEIVKAELHRQIAHLQSLEKDNSRLSKKVEAYEKQNLNIQLLKESNVSLSKKVRLMDELRRQAGAAQAEVEELKREKLEWLSFLDPSESSTPSLSTPRKLTKTLAVARIENATFRERMDSVELDLKERDSIIGELETQLEALAGQLAMTKEALGKAEMKVRQGEGRERMAEKEVEMLKRHLSSKATYTSEEANHHSSDTFELQKTARLSELETLLEQHKAETSRLVGEVERLQGLVERYGGSTTEIIELEKMEVEKKKREEKGMGEAAGKRLGEVLRRNEEQQKEIDTLRNENALLLKEIDSLELQIDRLTYDHNNGAYDPSTTKVLELRSNPDLVEHSIRTETLERLKKENKVLLERVEDLELLKDGAGAEAQRGLKMVPRESYDNLQAELEASQAVVRQKETMETRLKQAFSDKADEFRKAVLSLLGYRLDFLSSGRVKVSSLYAPSKDHSLLFSSASGGVGTMELVGAGSEKGALSDEVRRQVRFWVGERQCIPGFLASLTLTMFEETTKGGSAGFQEG